MKKDSYMETRKAWTTKGKILEADKAVIQTLTEKNPVAARIFVTGEVHENYIGDAAARLLVGINDTLYKNGVGLEPLFVETNDNTIRMTRFDPKEVWRCFHPDMLIKLIEEEAKRLNVEVDPWKMDCFDFYEEMVRVIRLKTEYCLPIAWKDSVIDDYNNAVYLSCLLIFNKPGYLDIPVSQYFAQPKVAQWMATVDYRKLTAPEIAKYTEIETLYSGIQGLTNPELHYIVDLFERTKYGSTAAPTFKEDDGL